MRVPPRQLALSFAAVAALSTLLIAAGWASAKPTGSKAGARDESLGSVTALRGYRISVFTKGTTKYFNPDSLVDDGSHIFIDYQNKTAADCSDAATASSTIVEYTGDGKVVKTFTIPGHSDGMRENPSTHLLWVTSCEDANARFVTVDPASGTITPYTFPPAPHGGGFDDMAFVNGKAFVAASNPTTNTAGVNTAPAVDEMSLSGGKVVLTPVLMGNASAKDLVTNQTVQLNLIDPDSMTVDPHGQLVLVNQAGSEIVYINNPGTSQQSVSRLPVGDQLDDTVFANRTQGRLLVSDAKTDTTYWIRGPFKPNSANNYLYTEAPSDSSVASFVGAIDPTTGLISPVVIGLGSPTGMIFVAGDH